MVNSPEHNADKLTMHIISYAYAGSGSEASGGDKIFIEFAKRWAQRKNDVTIHTWEAGYNVCRKHNLENVTFDVIKSKQKSFGLAFAFFYLDKTIRGSVKAFRARSDGNQRVAIYSSSDFWPDSIPGFIMKKRLRNAKWIAGLYVFAPNPFNTATDAAYRGGYTKPTLRSIVYYLSQQLIYLLMRRNADFVLVANELDKRIIVKDGYASQRIKPIYGGVDINEINQTTAQSVSYDGCFVGRLYPQKGPLELIKIWELVCKIKPGAKLALVGGGPLEKEIRHEIEIRKLVDNISMLGWLDGKPKYEILKSSKVFLHTPILDTGGMAAAEGMACGLPVVGFDLPGYRFAYPRGMLRAPVGNIAAFANLVLDLLHDKKLYDTMRNEAVSFSQEWNWDAKAQDILSEIRALFKVQGG